MWSAYPLERSPERGRVNTGGNPICHHPPNLATLHCYMTSVPLLSVLLLYPLTLLGDGCILIAIALAATVGGRPLIWGLAFALFHALYGVIGILVAGEIAEYSETLGHFFILVGSYILLRHFMHHSLHHQVGGDCSCENHKPPPVSTRAIFSTASAFSLHSLASGAIIRGMASDISTSTLLIVLLGMSILVGALISGIVFVGDLERKPILRALDKLPRVVAALLTGLCCFALFHLLHEIFEGSGLFEGIFQVLSIAISLFVGFRVHKHRADHSLKNHHHEPSLTGIGRADTKDRISKTN